MKWRPKQCKDVEWVQLTLFYFQLYLCFIFPFSSPLRPAQMQHLLIAKPWSPQLGKYAQIYPVRLWTQSHMTARASHCIALALEGELNRAQTIGQMDAARDLWDMCSCSPGMRAVPSGLLFHLGLSHFRAFQILYFCPFNFQSATFSA